MRPDDLLSTLIQQIIDQHAIDPMLVDDVIVGCAVPEAEQGMNVARLSALLAGLPNRVGGLTVNRLCASGLEAIAIAAAKIQTGQAQVILAGGVESMSMLPFGGHHIRPNPRCFSEHKPALTYTMGITAEAVAKQWHISREQQDAFALSSHQKAITAQQKGWFKSEITPITVPYTHYGTSGIQHMTEQSLIDSDNGPRQDTDLAQLSALKTVFHKNGTVTAGNSSQISDGAGLTLMVSESFMTKHQLNPMLRFCGYAVRGVAPEHMGIGPTYAIPAVLKQCGIEQKALSHIELNEAFAAQAVAVIQELALDPNIVNPLGGAIALGHPLGATGAIRTATLAHALQRSGAQYGMVTMCVGSGMGAAGLFENMQTTHGANT